MVGGGIEKRRSPLVPERDQHFIQQAAHLVQPPDIKGRRVEAQEAIGHRDLVLEISCHGRAPILIAPAHPGSIPQPGEQEARVRFRHRQEVRPIEHPPGVGEGAQHQAIPAGDHLLVAARPDALVPRRH